MKTHKLLLALVAGALCFPALRAQETLITNKGDILTVYDVEIGNTSVFYKLSAEEEASRKISKADVVMIKYKDGKVVRMDAPTDAAAAASVSPQPAPSAGATPFAVSPNFVEDNLKLVREFNSRYIQYKKDDEKERKADCVFCLLGLNEGSIVETPELKAHIGVMNKEDKGKGKFAYTKKDSPTGPYLEKACLAVMLENKTTKTLYIDLGNCFLMRCGQAEPYYVPSSTSQTSGSSGGVGVNLGAVTSAVGIGDALGTLASGVNVGGGTSSSSTTVTYSQRVIPIPPSATVALDYKEIGEKSLRDLYMPSLVQEGFFTKKKTSYSFTSSCKAGETHELSQPEGVKPLELLVTYSFDEGLAATNSLRMGFHLRQLSFAHIGLQIFRKLMKNTESSVPNPLWVFWEERDLRN